MGTGASSNPTRFTLATGLAASRWKSRANSTKSESGISSANLRQENDATSQVGVDDKLISPNDVKVEGRYENPFQKNQTNKDSLHLPSAVLQCRNGGYVHCRNRHLKFALET